MPAMQVLVTGGAGLLGSKVVPRLAARGHRVRVMTHSGRRVVGAESVTADLLTGDGLQAAVIGAECIIHLASSPQRDTARVDVDGTKRLLETAWRAGVKHVVFVSITGVDRLRAYPYYERKLEAEHAVQQGGVPWSIVRATQFHAFLDALLRTSARLPVMVVPRGFRVQPVDAGEVAARVIEVVDRGPQHMLPEMGGPEVLTSEQLAVTWREAHGIHRPLVVVPVPGKVAAGFRAGAATCPDHAVGRITWRQWLAGARG